jgi:hypothetical protein
MEGLFILLKWEEPDIQGQRIFNIQTRDGVENVLLVHADNQSKREKNGRGIE